MGFKIVGDVVFDGDVVEAEVREVKCIDHVILTKCLQILDNLSHMDLLVSVYNQAFEV